MVIAWDLRGENMLYKKVMQDLKSRIDSEEFAVGDTLPTERDLIDATQ
ncbi:hypothetical protein JCM19240_3304 [Vibrio maritimus]|uniref:HTH gntR-type domain-containing protein n=1 Tax=Vibrio maritimus TaxID=990268 RepID=A0A090TEC4_9VIBR|nr:hypothetical protein JCM19240_3304 [Vibrio maritimus]